MSRKFLVGKPHFLAAGVTGRGRGYVDLPLDNSGKPSGLYTYLKDAWRIEIQGVEKEVTSSTSSTRPKSNSYPL